MSAVDFDHRQSAHCESGTISSLLRYNGLELSEPMALGISGALTFAYIPLVKLGGLPLIAYRSPPGSIVRGVTRRLGIRMHFERFRDRETGMRALNEHLDAGRPVGLQTSVYWLPYFPKDLRFHFNAHNIVAYGRDNDEFLISDPTLENAVRAGYADLQKARFVKGVLAPKGLLYYPERLPEKPDLTKAIYRAIRGNTRVMLQKAVPIAGVKGIRFVGRKLRRLRHTNRDEENDNKRFIGHIVRMQEEIGTGGAGFRFLYASFLQEAAEITGNAALNDISQLFTDTGDEWRRFALYCAKMCKDRMDIDYSKLANQLALVADMEETAHRHLQRAVN